MFGGQSECASWWCAICQGTFLTRIYPFPYTLSVVQYVSKVKQLADIFKSFTLRLIYYKLLTARVWMRTSLTKERQSCVTEVSTNQLRGFGDSKYSPVHFEGAFAKLWGANISSVMCVWPSVRPSAWNKHCRAAKATCGPCILHAG